MASPLPLQLLLQLRIEGEVDPSQRKTGKKNPCLAEAGEKHRTRNKHSSAILVTIT
jgi:hypothetical protein